MLYLQKFLLRVAPWDCARRDMSWIKVNSEFLLTHVSLGNRDLIVHYLTKWAVDFFEETLGLRHFYKYHPSRDRRTKSKSYPSSTT